MGRSEEPSFLVVGHINKAHGLKGEVFVWPLTDHPASTFAHGVALYLGDADANPPPEGEPPIEVDTSRGYRRGYLIRFVGHEGRSAAEGLCGRYLLRRREAVARAEEGEVFYHELLGMRVLTVGGETVGEVSEVYELRPADLLEVQRAEGTVLIPFINEFVRSVDTEAGEIVVDPPEGLLDV